MPVSLDATVDVRVGVALVTARVSNPAPVAREVRLRNRLDGPVLPPRRRGVSAVGWSDAGFEGIVSAESTLALGYACPVGDGPSAERPLELVSVGAPTEEAAPPADRARRELAPASPPRDAVPLPDRGSAGGPATEPPRVPGNDGGTATEADSGTVADASNASVEPSSAVPDAVDAYLATVERRVTLGERLTDASVAEATAALADGDPDATPVEALSNALAADADALNALAERAERLAARAEATDVPVSALRRLA